MKQTLKPKWLSMREAKHLKEGCVVITRRPVCRGQHEYHYEADNWFRPDWVGDDSKYSNFDYEFLLLEDAPK